MTADIGTSATTFTALGGTGTVTGSKFLLEDSGSRVLVDCGIFQGTRDLRDKNWDRFDVEPKSIDAVVITHGHLDHCGYLPRLVASGFSGPVYCTPDTGRLLGVVLPDSGRLLEEEARFANRVGYSKHSPALPLYDEEAAFAALKLIEPVPFATPIEVAPGVRVTFEVAGHILGSAIARIELRQAASTIVFSGDLGRANHPLFVPPHPIGDADWIVVESTYGDRIHDDRDDAVERLESLITRTVDRGGVVVIPAFAVDRTEVLLFHLHELAIAGRLPNVPIYVDSPMALAALAIYRDALVNGSPDMAPDNGRGPEIFDLPRLIEVPDPEGSKRVSASTDPAIIIAGAGMASGGRVVHHLARFLPDPRNSVALVGYQAVGTRGRRLVDGEQAIKIHGRFVRVKAEICDLGGFSVHADGDELIAWLRTAEREPSGVFVVHGEETASRTLLRRIADELDWTAAIPRERERLLLGR